MERGIYSAEQHEERLTWTFSTLPGPTLAAQYIVNASGDIATWCINIWAVGISGPEGINRPIVRVDSIESRTVVSVAHQGELEPLCVGF